jgi:protein tyrosine phosphatase (PTP) superfamily phosphohydrolase (DUF442 family)
MVSGSAITRSFLASVNVAALNFIRTRIARGTTVYADEAGAWNELHGRFTMHRMGLNLRATRHPWKTVCADQPRSPPESHDLGVRHIVNLGLHTHEKALPDEATSVSRLGMTYIHIPVDFQNPTDQDFDQFCSAMEQLKDVPVHVHCIANYRVSAFFYRYRRDMLGMDEAEARADMEDVWHPEGVWATFVGR